MIASGGASLRASRLVNDQVAVGLDQHAGRRLIGDRREGRQKVVEGASDEVAGNVARDHVDGVAVLDHRPRDGVGAGVDDNECNECHGVSKQKDAPS